MADDEQAGGRIWSVEEHLADVLRAVRPLEPVELSLTEAAGLVLAEDVPAVSPLPPFDNSSMDGYAVRVADVEAATRETPARLRVTGDIAAGAAGSPPVGPGQAVRIMTGAPLPPGAEAVVPVEWTDGGTGGDQPADAMAPPAAAPAGGEVRVFRPVSLGAHVRASGSDITPGTLALAAGTVLGPPQVGLLAAIGRARVRVRPRPRVVVMSTGSELVPPGEALAPGQIYDANGPMLAAAAERAGAVVRLAPAVADDAGALRGALDSCLGGADLVLTSGGVSVGAYDVVKAALADPATGVVFRRLAMQPGKPQGFGLTGPAGTPLFALPGNPVSAYVSFEIFVRPALRALAGYGPDALHRPRTVARLVTDGGAPLTSPAGKRQFLRGSYTPPRPGERVGTVRPVGGPSSHLIGALARADVLLDIEASVTSVPSGADIAVVLLD
ncbi:gephyrin-like molybdotransferase Glp [Streptomyces sp. 7-21]|uniref:molybdotransferase-like divisome protein Glp n=1 Tax=Streptomyces sp. 7-21 TaxID=2802283 RepID=UPI00191F5512|nr:gephyrin-like molybdotransferase Glp [Streptomyces sp. 7-21]MBL1067439.1 molybdopterin molybdotransferase MoeA [Streptomyces sp. 7-21]